MKNKKTFAAAAALMVAAVAAFSSLSFNASAKSINELSAKADSYCAACGSCSTDCKSDASSNIYPHYEATSY